MVDASLRATILGSLRELNRAFGISLIYITHDLTTAYQISDNIVVLYRGSVAEVGDVERVVGDPKLRVSLGMRAREASRLYDVRACVDAMQALYDDVLRES